MRILRGMTDTPDPAKDIQRAEIAEHVAEFERRKGRIKTEDIQQRNGAALVVWSDHQGGKVRSNKAIRRE